MESLAICRRVALEEELIAYIMEVEINQRVMNNVNVM
jgi:hypothetical protein